MYRIERQAGLVTYQALHTYASKFSYVFFLEMVAPAGIAPLIIGTQSACLDLPVLQDEEEGGSFHGKVNQEPKK